MTMKDTGQQRQVREIKFRAWDKNLKEMHTVVAINWGSMTEDGTDGWVSYGRFGDSGNLVWYMLGKHILMQYINLKDKNGKEIYEGDIVANELNPQGFVIEWSNLGGFTFFCDSEYGSLPENWEVIGNIYENPNLLSQDK